MNRAGPRVTVVIPFYNDPYIGEAVDSVLAQTHPEVELIVVDDGSTMHSERLLPYRNRIHLLGKANGGTASALNHGMRHASGEYVAWLSSDDRFAKEKVAKQVKFMEETGAWISHTAFRHIDERGAPDGKAVQLAFGSMYRFYESFLKGNVVNGCTVMLRKELFDRLGGFDERLPYTHDYDFWLRCILSGYPLVYLNEPLTEYRRHPAMGTIRHGGEIEREFRRVREGYRERVRMLLDALEPRTATARRTGSKPR
ncbi:glycosyl transferase family 2 [Cohnella xylanilytica]|uniref:Glycosyltransferase n=1 Tax=Cohnella xylanilytica TaxID=557555 RepID=A0A841U0V0_9BACL|nr:glycosyltransferase [Cohnella xylanilytica]MBB6694156.1 glycosyltransferase [Cohnella xylanilytica]GIO11040.1 glycosyl transferase family 2 [Cohnella xylanilytica]